MSETVATTWPVVCRESECGEIVYLPVIDGRAPIEPLEGWTFTSDDGWQCPTHSGGTQP